MQNEKNKTKNVSTFPRAEITGAVIFISNRQKPSGRPQNMSALGQRSFSVSIRGFTIPCWKYDTYGKPPQQALNTETAGGSSRSHVLARPTAESPRDLRPGFRLQNKQLCHRRPTFHRPTPTVKTTSLICYLSHLRRWKDDVFSSVCPSVRLSVCLSACQLGPLKELQMDCHKIFQSGGAARTRQLVFGVCHSR